MTSIDFCKKCPLNTDDKIVVHSYGNYKTAKVVFVGEAPGADEEKQGKPFVGRAGQLLRLTMKEVGIDENDVVFANICRCRPLNNRTPTTSEMRCCSKYLLQELEGFKGLVVLLGNTPMSSLLNKKGITLYRGYGFAGNEYNYFATYHPSYVLRNYNPKTSEQFKQDLSKVKTWLDVDKNIQYTFIDTKEKVNDFLDALKNEPCFAFDLETTGLEPQKLDNPQVLMISFSFGSGKDKNWVLPLQHPESPFYDNSQEVMDSIAHIFSSSEIFSVGQNGKFDVKWLKYCFGIDVLNFKFDTKIGHYLYVGERDPQSLKSMAWKYTDYGGYGVLDVRNLRKKPISDVAQYCILDSFVTYLVMFKLFELLSDAQVYLLMRVLSPASIVLSEMELDGMRLHEENLEKISKEYLENLQKLEEKMHSYDAIEKIEEKNKKLINFRSPKQLGEVLKVLGIAPEKKTSKSGQIATDKDTLKLIKNKHPFIGDLLKHRELEKISGTYLEPYNEVNINGIIYAEYLTSRTATGRLACKKPNLQNIPYGIRKVFTAKRSHLIEIDFSQLELRTLAFFSQDDVLINAFQNGKDIHEETRFAIFGDNSNLSDEKKTKQRVEAKTINFGIVYGISAYSLSKQLKISEREAQRRIDTFLSRYPKVKDFIMEMQYRVEDGKYITTFFGRKWKFSVYNGMSEKEKKHIYNMAVNYPIQCLSGNTPVLTNFGYRPISTIKIGDKVWSGKKWTNVIDVGRKKQREFRIYTDRGYVISASKDHKFMLENGTWKKVKELRSGDYLKSSATKVINGKLPNNLVSSDIFKTSNCCNSNIIRSNALIFHSVPTIDDTWMLGFLIGNGSYGHKNGVDVSIGFSESMTIKYKIDSIWKSYGMSPHWKLFKYQGNLSYWRGRVEYFSFRKWLIKLGLFRVVADKKRIPIWLFTAPIEFRLALLAGLFDSDGGITGTTSNGFSFCYTTVSKGLANDIFLLLNSVGCRSTIRELKPSKKNHKIPYRVILCLKDAVMLDLPLVSEKKKKLWNVVSAYYSINREKHNDYYRIKIIDIQDMNQVIDMYDLCVDDFDHSFMIYNVVSHNSTARDLVFDAEARLWKWMRENQLESKIIADVHDSILIDATKDEFMDIIVNAKLLMEDFSQFFTF